MKKVFFSLLLFTLLLTSPCFATTETIATMGLTKMTYQDMVDIFNDELHRPQFYSNWLFNYKVYKEKDWQNNKWSVETCNDGYTESDGKYTKEFSLKLNMDNGYIEFCTFSSPIRYAGQNSYNSNNFGERSEFDKTQKEIIAAFLEESCKWKRRWRCESWSLEQFNAIESLINIVEENTNLWALLIENNNLETIDALIKAGADINEEDDYLILFGKHRDSPSWKSCPLFYSAQGNKIEIFRKLIENGADINKQIERDDDRYGIHKFSIFNNSESTAAAQRLLIDNGYIFGTGFQEEVYPEYYHLKYALNKGWKVYEGYLTQVCRMPGLESGQEDYILDLLIENGADVNEKEPWNVNPLYSSLYEGYKVKQVQSLIKHGAKVKSEYLLHPGFIDLNNRYFSDTLSILDLLLDTGADINISYDDGNSLIFKAIPSKSYYSDTRPLLENSKLLFDKLIQRGIDVNHQNNNGLTPLMAACNCNENSEIMQILLLAGADASLKNNKGETALDIAIKNNCTDIIPLLKLAQKKAR